MFSLKDKVALVTGASQGIGRATARALAEAGAKVAAAARNIDKLASIVAEIEAAGGEAFAVPMDVADVAQVKKRSGRIINITSVVAETGNAGQANYVASKAGLIGLTRAIAVEVASRSITVNAVAPGFIATPMTDPLPDELKEKMKTLIPLGRFGSDRDVAAAVVFLASDEAGYITGQVLGVNGGLHMG
jgi:NAD(P)-dependent dehydrogenase (short-subunit alcohol dehydrogenase family)